MTKDELEATIKTANLWSGRSTLVLAIGILGEYALLPFLEKKRWHLSAKIFFAILVVAGIIGEYEFSSQISQSADELQRISDGELKDTTDKAGKAIERASRADERASEAKLELARLTAPIYSVPVVRGLATPDLSQGVTQRILLFTDTRVATPLLPRLAKDATVPWTLFLDQDFAGSHLYELNFLPDLLPLKGLKPNTRASLEFVTDASGRTSMRGLPVINRPIPK